MRQRGWQDQGMEDEESIDPVTQTPGCGPRFGRLDQS